jgi:hypothetical protein
MTAKNSATEKPEFPGARVNYALGPLAAGMILDAVDVITFGPAGLFLGIPVGALAGYWLATSLRLSQNTSLLCAAFAAVYCTIPGTEILPLGTLVGALLRFEEAAPSVDDQEPARTEINSGSMLEESQPRGDVQAN